MPVNKIKFKVADQISRTWVFLHKDDAGQTCDVCILLNDFSFIYPVQEGVISFGVTSEGGYNLENGGRVPYETVVSNAGGRYDSQLHEFVCPTSGMYQFSLGVVATSISSNLAIMMNGNILVGKSLYCLVLTVGLGKTPFI